MDPISDQFAFVSVYNYAENSPIGNIDLHGLQAWEVTQNWTEFTINSYRKFSQDRVAEFRTRKDCFFTCEDLPIATLILFASENGLPVTIENGSGSYSASDTKYSNMAEFYVDVAKSTGASDLQRSNNTVQLGEGLDDLANGEASDILLLRNGSEGSDRAKHAQMIYSNSGTTVDIGQGNFSQIGSTVGGSSDPSNISYLGVQMQRGQYDLQSETFFRRSPLGFPTTQDASLFNLERRQWNFEEFNRQFNYPSSSSPGTSGWD